MQKKISIYLIIFSTLFTVNLIAQIKSDIFIEGKVIDTVTKEPKVGATIIFSKTNMTITNDLGFLR